MATLGESIKKARLQAGFSQKQVAKKVGITDSRLSKMERDLNPCPPNELKKLANLYKTSVVNLYIVAGFLSNADLNEYKMFFRGVNELDDLEIAHIQQCIDLLTRRK